MSARTWVLLASIAGCSLASSACELVVGSGNFSTGDGGGGGSGSGGSSGTGCVTLAGVTICKNDAGGILGNGSGGASSSGASSSSGGSASGSGGSSSAGSGGSSAGSSSGSGIDSAMPFLMLTSLTFTETFEQCSPDSSYDNGSSNPASSITEAITVTRTPGVMDSINVSTGLCSFTLSTYVSGDDYFATVPSGMTESCAVTNATTGATTTSTYTTFVVELVKGSTSASFVGSGSAAVTEPRVATTTCASTSLNGTASQ